MSMPPGPRTVDPVDRAHLTGVSRPSPPIHRYAPSAHLADLAALNGFEGREVPAWTVVLIPSR